jgi:GNAT superfamily N-acetyltransferase
MEKHLAGQFTVDMLAVHPAYWRRGHGTALLKEAAKLADIEQVPLGIAAVEMGVKNCERNGFKNCEVIKVDGYSQHPGSFKVWIGVREPISM